MKKFFIYLIATTFGLGYFPKLPGTFTSLITTIAAYYLLGLSFINYLALILIISLAGIYFTGEANKIAKEKDKNIFSLDEVPGQFLAFIPLYFFSEHRIFLLLIGFGLFRFFDIVKPGLIKRSEALSGGLGVVMDDLLSGIFAAFCLQIIILFL